MAFLKSKTNIVFLFIIFLLVACLAGVSYFAYEKHNDYVAVSANLTQNTASLTNAKNEINQLNSKIEDMKAEIESASIFSEQEKNELNAKLQQALSDKEKLGQEATALKTQVEQLSAQIEQLKVEKRREELQKFIALDKVAQSAEGQEGVCYLTFDDGPSDNTIKVLDILDNYEIKGTFFVVGNNKSQYMAEIVNRGHAIGIHTATHRYEAIYKDVNSYLEDFRNVSDIIYNATGVRTNIMRFPGGSSNLVSAKYCEGIMTDLSSRMQELGYSYFDWNVNSGDADAINVPANTIVQNVLNGAKGKKSICVLMHDTAVKSTTVDALPSIIEGLREMGFRFEALNVTSFGYHQPIGN